MEPKSWIPIQCAFTSDEEHMGCQAPSEITQDCVELYKKVVITL